MAGMRIYTVHQRVWSSSPDRDAVLVREGFSWPAFFFSVAWALVHRMWFAALLMAAALAGLAALTDALGVSGFVAEAIGLAVAFWIGCEANDWRRAALRRRGYAELGVVCAADRARAEHRAFELRAGTGS